MFTRIKICGITSVDDAIAVANAGADAIGLVFYAKSLRLVDLRTASDIAKAVGPLVTTVGLFVNATASEVESVLNKVPLHVLQFHGDEDANYCQQFKRPFLKALRVKANDTAADVSEAIKGFPNAAAILLDTYSKGVAGGTGETFNWNSVPQDSNTSLILAGGLNQNNVADAIKITRPYAVDVSSGVEREPGKKDIVKVKQFIEQVRISSS